MVELVSERTDRVFHALSDGTRRQLLAHLARRPATVGELAEPFEMSLAAVSKHIKVLERAGLVRQTKQGRTRICELQVDALSTVTDLVAYYQRFWTRRLESLDRVLKAKRTTR
ncbi:MAG: winged helix-turn-helix transcriptional regulator [Myxococcales bacterium FL481]|nr:MAG: winged helix-turn-helix transcriptional regulator [Myxococcales bacterium FL481]